MIAKKIALGFGIAVVFPMLIHYGVSTFVHSPKWQDYQVQGTYDPHASPEERAQHQAEQQKKQEERRAAEKRFQQHLFAFAVPLGLIALVVGAFLRLPALGTGLMFGGIFSVCDGYFHYWSELADVLKFISLLVAFALLIFLGYRRLERKEI
jgi:H+/gluconate symporter-like permease